MQPFTRDQEVIASRLKDREGFFYALNGRRKVGQSLIRPDRDYPRPGEAIYQATKYLEKSASPERRKVVIIISWGRPPLYMASTHRHTAAEVSRLIDQTGTTVYGLYLTVGRTPGTMIALCSFKITTRTAKIDLNITFINSVAAHVLGPAMIDISISLLP